MNFVPTEQIQQLLCSTCSKVLSQFPIYCHREGSICGRCPYKPDAIRNEAYEAIVKKIKFPCSHNENGCMENILPKNVDKHERLCNFRIYPCPIMCTPPCTWKGFVSSLLDHVSENHKIFLLNENSFEMDFVNNHNENYLLPYGEDLFVVNRRTESKWHLCECTISYIGTCEEIENSSYKIILQNSNKSCTYDLCAKINTTTSFDWEMLKVQLKDPLSVIAKIEIILEEEEEVKDYDSENEDNSLDVNYKMLKELECLVCFEYMVPPIYQCTTGHSICNKCKEEVIECPTCKSPFANTQNYILAQVISHLPYPCKYKKCKYTAKAIEITNHEATCKYAPYKCPLWKLLDCKAEMQLEEMYKHTINNHYEYFLEIDTVCIPFNPARDAYMADSYIIKYGSKLFILNITYDENVLQFTVQLIGPVEEASQYRFEIHIFNTSMEHHRVIMTCNCAQLNYKGNYLSCENSVHFLYDQIKHLITDQLNFRVRLFNN